MLLNSSQEFQQRSNHKDRLLPNPKLRLREQVHEVTRFKQLSPRTEEAYWDWIRRFLVFHRRKAAPHPYSLSPLLRNAERETSRGGHRHAATAGSAV